MISVIIPVYKNLDLFFKNLKHNLPFLKNTEIIIVNDNPEDHLSDKTHILSTKIKVLENPENLGFGESVNRGVQEAQSEYVLLLNSDVRLIDAKYQNAIKEFQNPQLFALSFAQKDRESKVSVANTGYWQQGLFHHTVKNYHEICPTLWPEGGSSLIRREYFLKMGGFDRLFSPFYWEDVDLGYRAQKHGYISLFYPKVLVEHHHATTIGKYFSQEAIKTIAVRNQFLFVWKNATVGQFVQHLLWLPYLLLKCRREPGFLPGFVAAIRKRFALYN